MARHVVVKLRDVEDAIFSGLNSSRELRRAFNDFIDDVHDTWKRFSPKPTGAPRKKDLTVAERWETYLEVRGSTAGHPYSTGDYVAHVKKKKLPLRQRLFIKRTLRQGVPIGQVYNDSDIAHLVEYGSGSDKPDSRSPWGPKTPTPEFAPMRKTVALMNGERRYT